MGVRGRGGAVTAPQRSCYVARVFARDAIARSRAGVCFVGVLAGLLGCAVDQKMTVEVLDARLRSQGEALVKTAAPRGALSIGAWRAESIVRGRAPTGAPLLERASPRPSVFYELSFVMVAAAGERWPVRCALERRAAENADLAAESDEDDDVIGLQCGWALRGAAWRLRAAGSVRRGMIGEVRGEGEEAALKVEVIAERRWLGQVDRALPTPAVQLRREGVAVAAMLLDAPERAWLAREEDEAAVAAAMTAMVALRLLPIRAGE